MGSPVAVVLNGLVINGFGVSAATDTYGSKWMLTDDIDGWDSPDSRTGLSAKTGSDGAFFGEGALSGRPLVMRGITKCNSAGNYWKSRRLLEQTTNLLHTSALMTVDEIDYVLGVQVKRAGRVRMKLSGSSQFSWEIPLIAADPFKYSQTQVTGVSIPATVAHAGNATAYPVITVTTVSASDVVITNDSLTGDPAIVIRDAVNGMVINPKRRSLTISGVDNYQKVNISDTNWWGLQPGNNVITCSGVTTATIAYYPTFL